MTKEEAKALYEGKYFYEIVKTDDPAKLELFGPMDTIRYLSKEGIKSMAGQNYLFGQVINGQLVQTFKENEILVTDRIL